MHMRFTTMLFFGEEQLPPFLVLRYVSLREKEVQQACIAILIILFTAAAYLAMVKLYVRFPYPFLIPVLTTTIFIIAVS